MSVKIEHSDKGSKYFIGYKDDIIIRPLCIILPHMSGFIKYFDKGGKKYVFYMIAHWLNIMKFGTELKRH